DAVFFFQAEDGIRDLTVTGVQTCALPISFGIFCLSISSRYLIRQCSAAWRKSALTKRWPRPAFSSIRSLASPSTELLRREEQNREAIVSVRLRRLPTLFARSALYFSMSRSSEKSASFPIAISLIK